MSSQLPPFPVTTEDIIESIASQVSPAKRGSLDLTSSPKLPPKNSNSRSAGGTPPPGKPPIGSSGFLSPSSLSPSGNGSRRPSLVGFDADSRRSSVAKVASDLRKGVRNVTDTTKKATNKVKDKTAGVGAHAMGAAVGASRWVATHTSKSAKAAMDQAKSGLSLGEKLTLFASEKITVLSRKGFTHFFMFVIFISYTALGALLFIACEAPHEEKEKLAISEERLLLTEALWNKRSTDFASYKQEVKVLLEPYEDQLYRAFTVGVSSNTDEKVWTFWKAMFFCSTITTTIGYGHITPKTTAGRALCIVYAIIGIPIFLILMADFGKLFTRLLKHTFIFLRRVYKSGTCVKARKHPTVQRWRHSLRMGTPSHSSTGNLESVTTGTDLDKMEVEPVSEDDSDDEEYPKEIEEFRQRVQEAKSIHKELSVNGLQKIHNEKNKIHISKSVPQHLLNIHYLEKVQEEPGDETNSRVKEYAQNEENEIKENHCDDEPEIHLDEQENENISRSCCTLTDISKKASGGLGSIKDRMLHRKKPDSDPEEGVKRASNDKTDENGAVAVEMQSSPTEDAEKYFADDGFKIPVSLALFILLLYMIVGCIIYISWEHWTFFEAFYFIFVSMTTIGFGDFVPEHPAFMMATALYLVFGLALTAMCINIIQEKLTHTFREASTKLKESFSKIMEAAAASSLYDFDTPLEGPIIVGPILDDSLLPKSNNVPSSDSLDQ